ncbi:hypothetical protein ML401_23325 [Bradyrhizobium sp. 62B]|uniref:hypothetical protein n=1 Tax=Bradyrhizobium sp. 62B TaxID=2898442 RepID=UPI0025581FD3|nr:hypothetical protein ML401_23325 [Bradyrhizobium sp. 62B]
MGTLAGLIVGTIVGLAIGWWVRGLWDDGSDVSWPIKSPREDPQHEIKIEGRRSALATTPATDAATFRTIGAALDLSIFRRDPARSWSANAKVC